MSSMDVQDKSCSMFDAQLELIYKSSLDLGECLGVAFFESCGYYDSAGANTIKAYIDSANMQDFWTMKHDTIGGIHREEDEAADVKREREKAKAGVDMILSELNDFATQLNGILQATQQPSHTAAAFSPHLPPFSGALLRLKRSRSRVLSSWSKRWFYLDFQSYELWYHKRGALRKVTSDHGCIQLSTVTKVLTLNSTDFQIQYEKTGSVILRARNAEEKCLWVNLVEFAIDRCNTTRYPDVLNCIEKEGLLQNVVPAGAA